MSPKLMHFFFFPMAAMKIYAKTFNTLIKESASGCQVFEEKPHWYVEGVKNIAADSSFCFFPILTFARSRLGCWYSIVLPPL